MSLKKFRWSQVYESSEEELIDFLQARNIEGERIHAVSENTQPEQRTDNITTLWCAEGSLVVKTGPTDISLQSGDALRMDADTTYTIQPGIADCAYYITT